MNTKQIIDTIKNSLDYYEGIGRVVDEPMNFVDNLILKVPTFVANWYEDTIEKGLCDTILDLVDPISHVDEKVVNWFEQITENDQYHHANDMIAMIFTRMYLFGYEVYVL